MKEPHGIVVIFKTHLRPGADQEAYAKASRRVHELVETIPGFISIKAFAGEDGEEIDIVRFESEEALEAWRNQPEHRIVQDLGRTVFYDYFHVEACRVFREYEFAFESGEPTSGPRRSVKPNPDGAGSTRPSGRG